jgi:hypothetical protein
MGKCEMGTVLVDKATYTGSSANPRLSFEVLKPVNPASTLFDFYSGKMVPISAKLALSKN